MIPTIIHYLEMTDPAQLCPGHVVQGLDVVVVDPPDPGLNRRFYREVGGDWEWTDRLVWSDAEWRQHVCRSELVTGIGRIEGQDIGYFELESQHGGNIQLQYFGLLPGWIGRGVGGTFLSEAVRLAWAIPGARRVWVHTCTKDHKHALANYERRGFCEYHREQA